MKPLFAIAFHFSTSQDLPLIQYDRSFLGHFLNGLLNAFPAYAAQLESAERHIARPERTGTIHHNTAYLEPVRYAKDTMNIFRKHARLKSVR